MNERNRKLAVAVGVAALVGGAGALLAARGAVAGFVGVLYAAGGALGVAMAVLVYREWASTESVDPPAVERAVDHPYPGEQFDRTLAQFDGDGQGHLPDKNAIHDRVRALATHALARTGKDTYDEAETAVRAGEWPDDDPEVADFLESSDPDRSSTSVADRVRSAVGETDDRSEFQTMVRRSVDALASRPQFSGDVDAERSVVDLDPHDGEDRPRTTRWPADAEGASGGAEPPAASGDGGSLVESVSTGRWGVVVPVGLGFVGFGFLLQRAALVFAGTVAFGLAVYARAFSPVAAAPTIERSFDAADPEPGDEVAVTVTVRNDTDRTFADLTIVDGVPEGLAVTEGSPRHAATLRPGRSTSFTYSLTARRGDHAFGPVYTVVRDVAGARADVRLRSPTEASDSSLTVVPSWDALPTEVALYEQAGEYLGRLPAGGGEGIEFHSTREYRPGDSMARIDWKHLARSPDDELTTVRFREERAATVALVIDTYPVAYRAGDDGPSAVERSVTAASRLFDSLLDSGDRVGVAALGATPRWIAPDSGLDHRQRVTDLLATDDAFPPTPAGTDEYHPRWVREFHRRFPAETQVILLSPLCDGRYQFLIRQLRGYGHPVTVVSPDPTVDGTVGQRLVALERRLQIETLRESGVRVLDWGPDESLAVAVGRAGERWSR